MTSRRAHLTISRGIYKALKNYSAMDKEKALVVFQDKKIRRVWHEGEWYFSVVEALTDSDNPRNYWSMLKKRESDHSVELSTFCVQLKLPASDRKEYQTDCASTKNMFRIIQSIPSHKAEPFKQWLAQERVKEYCALKGLDYRTGLFSLSPTMSFLIVA